MDENKEDEWMEAYENIWRDAKKDNPVPYRDLLMVQKGSVKAVVGFFAPGSKKYLAWDPNDTSVTSAPIEIDNVKWWMYFNIRLPDGHSVG
jgi:hypothetical protein